MQTRLICEQFSLCDRNKLVLRYWTGSEMKKKKYKSKEIMNQEDSAADMFAGRVM